MLFSGLSQFAPTKNPQPSKPEQRTKSHAVKARAPPASNFSGYESSLQSQLGAYAPKAAESHRPARGRSPTHSPKRPALVSKRSPVRSPCAPSTPSALRVPALVEAVEDRAERIPAERAPGTYRNVSIDQLETAWDAMEYFMRVNPETEEQMVPESEAGTAPRFVHLNVSKNKDFRPYDLVVTDELHKDPEHWTMSLEGMLHVIPGEDSEFFTLGEWSANAIAYSSCCRIPFFRSYTVTKGFYFWRRCVRQRAFMKRRKRVQDQLFGHRKSFRSTYRLVQASCADIRATRLSDIELRRMYTLEEFIDVQYAVRVRGGQAVHMAIEHMQEELVWLCDQLEQRKRESGLKDKTDDREMAKAIESHMSMSEVKAEQKKRARLLAESLSEAVEVGTFVRLSDIGTVESQLFLATETVVGIQTLLQRHLAEVTKGMFVVTVNMSPNDIIYEPTRSEFVDAIREMIDESIKIVVKAPRLAHVKQLNLHLDANASQFSSVADLLGENQQFKDAVDDLMGVVNDNYDQVMLAGAAFEEFRDMYTAVVKWDIENYVYNHGTPHTAQELQDDVRKSLDWKERTAKMKVSTECGIFHVDTRDLRDRLRPLVDVAVQDMKDTLQSTAGEWTNEVWLELQNTIKKLNDRPRSVEDFSELLTVVKTDRTHLLTKVRDCDNMYATCKEIGMKLSNQEVLKHEDLHESVEMLQESTGKALRQVDDLLEAMCEKLDESLKAENDELLSILNRLNSDEYVNPELDPTETLAKLNLVGKKLKVAERSMVQSMKYEQQFRDLALPDRTNLDETLKVFEYRKEFWSRVEDWKESEETWLSTKFVELEIQELSDTVTQYLKAAQQLFKEYHEPVVLELLKSSAERYQQWIPSLFLLGNPAMQSRHWTTFFEHLAVPLPSGMNFNLQDLISWRIFENKVQIQEISAVASGEWALAQSLRKVEESMNEATFVLSDYKGVQILSGIDDLYAVLDENKMTLQIMRSSRFITGVKQDVESWERKLSLVEEVLEEWLFCQRNWRYLQNIFSVPDIQKQLPAEAMDFQHVDLKWREIMIKTAANPNVMDATTAPGILDMFLENKELLQKVQSSLDAYLEMKRAVFPRFYFLSDDELLQILSHVKDPMAVQPHMSKLFAGIKMLGFESKKREKAPSVIQIEHMYSAEAERVSFENPVAISKTTNVENWLGDVERKMTRTLYSKTERAYYQHQPAGDTSADMAGLRNEWLFKWPAMCVLTVEQIIWQEDMADAMTGENPGEDLELMLQHETTKLADLTALVCGDLTQQQRHTIEALLVLSIHARDITVELTRKGVQSTGDFNWLRQLRYIWDKEAEKLVVEQVKAAFDYRYEYLGNSSRLVITPLTDRCYLTLTNALNLKLGGCPYGKAGTGKTETVKDLAKALARQCIVFNCSDGLDFQTMGRFFSGLAQAGSWVCFDEFNRIDVEVLSVVAQQCLSIQQALMQDAEKFTFEGKYIPLDRNYGCFVTMNPSAGGVYGGRAELPDNLKALFRPVAMQVPDVVLIAQNMLFAQGFLTAENLARKVVHLYRLASEQLSQQKHYDWMLRAMKPVLAMAGAMKRADPDVSEDLVLIRALRNSSLPKLVGHDVPLFEALIGDLFPGMIVPRSEHGRLQRAIESQLAAHSYTVVPTFVEKIIQLMDTLKGRHGVGLVGAPGTGKTVAQNTLAGALEELNQKDQTVPPVIKMSLNPKSISMGQLYGEYNYTSAEWTDGLVPALLRQMLGYTDARNQATKWLTFDGPVDAYWIESMNTTLDDNKLLCLTNGERLQLPGNVNLLFEVEELTHASPATVSRIGMVYFEPAHLGWKAVVSKWCAEHTGEQCPCHFPDDIEKRLGQLIERALRFFEDNRYFCPAHILTPDIHRVQSFLGFLHTITSSEYVDDLIPPVEPGPGARERELEQEQQLVGHKDFFSMSLAFSYVWSFGASLNSDETLAELFDEFARGVLGEFCDSFPFEDKGTPSSVYDFCIDYDAMQWVKWSTTVPEFQYHPDNAEPMVPTVTTTRILYLLRVLTCIGTRSVLISGSSGVGKTSITAEFQRQGHAELSFANVSFTAVTGGDLLLSCLETRMDQRGKDILAPPTGTKMMVVVDDLSMPQPDEFGTQRSSECLRQFVDANGFYDRNGLFWKSVVDSQVIATLTPPGGGHSAITSRLLRHFDTLCMPEHADGDLTTIFGSLLNGLNLSQDPASQDRVSAWLSSASSLVVSMSVSVFLKAVEHLLPTPSKCHYIFNVRDILRVFQGFKCFQISRARDEDQYIRLWTHELRRVFADRLNDSKEVTWFEELLAKTILTQYGKQWGPEHFVPSIFGSFCTTPRSTSYTETVIPAAVDGAGIAISSEQKMTKDLEEALDDFNRNEIFSGQEMDMVLFRDTRERISSTLRVLRQSRGNMLLLGLSGCGRRSVVTLAAYVMEAELFQIQVGRGYGLEQFREDLKDAVGKACGGNKRVVFFLSEAEIVDDTFLQDINDLMSTGFVAQLFAEEELSALGEGIRNRMVRDNNCGKTSTAGRAPLPTPEEIQGLVARAVMDNMHVVLSLSPVGKKFASRMRTYPALTSWCTIQWYHAWPREALLEVARHWLTFVEPPPTDEAGSDTSEDAIHQRNQETLLSNMDVVSKLCVDITEAVNQQIQRLGKTNFEITPKFFVELLQLFKTMLVDQDKRLSDDLARLQGGLTKLYECNELVEKLHMELEQLQPRIAEMTEETITLMGHLASDKEEADAIQAQVRREQNKVEDASRRMDVMKKAATKDLDVAMPHLNAAIAALETLSKSDITEVKSFSKPPPLVMKVMESVCVLMNVTPSWPSAQKLLTNLKFIETLKDYDKDHITVATQKALGKYVNDPEFKPEKVANVSLACKTICMWVIAIDTYAEVAADVRPKQAKLLEAQEQAAALAKELQGKQDELAKVTARVDGLQQKYEDSLRRRDNLDNQMHDSKIRISRAEKLTRQLAGEQERWSKMVEHLNQGKGQLVGDTLLAAAFIGYAGSFDMKNRNQLVSAWVRSAVNLNIAVNTNFSLNETLGIPVLTRKWKLQGLPADLFSIDNALIIGHSRRWSLLTDPQGQGGAWIKTMEQPNGIRVLKANDPQMLRTVENSIRMGIPVLLQDVGETMDPSMRPVFEKRTKLVQGREVIQLGDVDVDYHEDFRLYATCSLPNPDYTPEIHTVLTVINFVVTLPDLAEQLLTMVVAHERLDLEEEKDQLVLQIDAGQKELSEVEGNILNLLSRSDSGNILDDEAMIKELDSAKNTSEKVTSQLAKAEKTSAEINIAREGYRVVATRGSLLYFAIVSMSTLNSMYQYSLDFFRELFNDSLKSTPADRSLDIRLQSLVDSLTERVFDKVSRGLFAKDKQLFSFVIATKILMEAGEISAAEWDFLVRGPGLHGSDEGSGTRNPCSAWMTDASWANLRRLSGLEGLGDLQDSVSGPAQSAWMRHASLPEMHTAPIPAGWDASLSSFQKLLLNKTLREDMLELSVIHFVEKEMGRRYIESTGYTLESLYKDSSAQIPIILILSPAADPTKGLLDFSREKEMDGTMDRDASLEIISLGQGQGPRADVLVRKACNEGTWVCLQNCHLCLSWMPHLEALVEEIAASLNPKPGFRLWLTSLPSGRFPVSIIQRSAKIANELPRGLRANLLRTYREMPAAKFEHVATAKRKLMFSLAFFHAAILDRCTYGATGFNIPYEWTAADLDVSIAVLGEDLSKAADMAATLMYMIGKVHYGGRVTDSWDQRCVQCLLSKFLSRGTMDTKLEVSFNDEGVYYAPSPELSQQECIEFISKLPMAGDPTVSGLHECASLKFQMEASKTLMHALVDVSNTAKVKSSDSIKDDNDTVRILAERIYSEIGDDLRVAPPPAAVAANATTIDALRTALEQEVARFNALKATMRASLRSLQEAMTGRMNMTKKLDAVYTSLLLGRVPSLWKQGTESGRSLGSWLAAFALRGEFIQSWCSEEPPPGSYYLPGLFFPQGLLAAAIQQYARRHGVASDTLRLHTQPTRVSDPEELRYLNLSEYGGIYLHGVWLDGGRWNAQTGMLQDPVSTAGSITMADPVPMPVVWCRPMELRTADLIEPATPRISTPGGVPSSIQSPASTLLSQKEEGGRGEMRIQLEAIAYDGGTSDRGSATAASAARTSPTNHSASPKARNFDDADMEVGMLTSNGGGGSGRAADMAAHSPTVGGRVKSPFEPISTPLPPDTVLYPTPSASFTCPLYQTAERGGAENGWVMNCELGISGRPDHWVLRGTAILCEGPH